MLTWLKLLWARWLTPELLRPVPPPVVVARREYRLKTTHMRKTR